MKRNTPTLKEQFHVLNSLVTRSALMNQMGQSYGGKRDLYEQLGYPKELTFEQYIARYIRQDIARRIVTAFPDACWSKPPDIKELDTDNDKTEFEKKWEELVRTIPVWQYFKRVDSISGIGRYGVLLMGFDDGQALDKPVKKASRLLYMRPFYETGAQILQWEENVNNERYGLPLMYNLTISQPSSNGGANLTSKIVKVHYTRVLHIADGLQTDDIYGTPRLEAVYNRLQDLDMIAGGGAEMWWRGAFPGLGFKAVDGATFNEADIPALENEIEDYVHGLKRYLKLKNIDIEQLTPQLADSTKPFDVEITLISVATGIPKRILMGSERGELASTQDSSEWDDRVEERRTNFCAPMIINPFLNRLIEVGVLPTPATGFGTYWSPMHIMGEKEKAEIAKAWTEAITKYAGTPGAEFVVPTDVFLRDIMGNDDDKVRKIMEANEKALAEEQARIEEEQLAAQADAEAQAKAGLESQMALESHKAAVKGAPVAKA